MSKPPDLTTILIRMTRERIGWCIKQYQRQSPDNRRDTMDAIKSYVAELERMEHANTKET